MTKTRLQALCELAKAHDIDPFSFTEDDVIYTLTYRGKPLYAHYSSGTLFACIYNGTQFRFVPGIGRGPSSLTTAYRLHDCHTIAWLFHEKSGRHYKDSQGEIRDTENCKASESCDYADLIPIA